MAKPKTVQQILEQREKNGKLYTKRQVWPDKWPTGENLETNFNRENPYYYHNLKYIS